MDTLYVGGRGNGKTLHMIKRSAETGRTIVVFNQKHADRINKMANDLGIDIPEAVGINKFRDDYYRFGRANLRKGILVDDLDIIITRLFKDVPIIEATVTDLPTINFINRKESED